MRARPESTKVNTTQPGRKAPYRHTRHKTKKIKLVLPVNSSQYIDAPGPRRFRRVSPTGCRKFMPRTKGLRGFLPDRLSSACRQLPVQLQLLLFQPEERCHVVPPLCFHD